MTLAVQQAVAKYIEAREEFDKQGGKAMMDARRAVRDAYCNTMVSREKLSKWLSSIDDSNVQGEFARRFQEWDHKLERNLLKRNENPTLSEGEFLELLQEYYNKNVLAIQGPGFQNFGNTKACLREMIAPLIKDASGETVEQQVEAVAKQYDISDQELLSRMRYEWSWKV